MIDEQPPKCHVAHFIAGVAVHYPTCEVAPNLKSARFMVAERLKKVHSAWTFTLFHTSCSAYNQVEGMRQYCTNDVGGIAHVHALSFQSAAFHNMHSSRGQRHSGGGQ